MKKFICISCPIGCHLTATEKAGEWEITGNRCARGVVYAKSELTDPRRMVTATVGSDSELMPRIPVRTSAALPKRHVGTLLNKLYSLRVKIPVDMGEILLHDVEESGVDIIFSCNCHK